jgi:hypothetical protein
LNTVDTSESDSSPEVDQAPSIFGDDLSLVTTDRIVKKAVVEGKLQTIKLKAVGYEFEPLIVIANKGMNTKLSLDLRDFDSSDEKFNISDSNTKEIMASFDGKKDIVLKDVKFERAGSFVIANEKNVLTVILVMEVLALKAKDGSIRTAFNTCQVCYSTGKGYYVQQGDELVCQNCGNRFKPEKVGIVKGGCNPVPIAEYGKADDGKIIKVDKTYLNKNKSYFSNWKA